MGNDLKILYIWKRQEVERIQKGKTSNFEPKNIPKDLKTHSSVQLIIHIPNHEHINGNFLPNACTTINNADQIFTIEAKQQITIMKMRA